MVAFCQAAISRVRDALANTVHAFVITRALKVMVTTIVPRQGWMADRFAFSIGAIDVAAPHSILATGIGIDVASAMRLTWNASSTITVTVLTLRVVVTFGSPATKHTNRGRASPLIALLARITAVTCTRHTATFTRWRQVAKQAG